MVSFFSIAVTCPLGRYPFARSVSVSHAGVTCSKLVMTSDIVEQSFLLFLTEDDRSRSLWHR